MAAPDKDDATGTAAGEAGCFATVYAPGPRMNDHSFIRVGGQWHCFHIWLDDPALDQVIGHATSPDLETWTRQPEILPKLPPPAWESDAGGNAPHVFSHDGTFYLFYSRYREGRQQIGLATSHDLYDWQRYRDNPVFRPAPFWCPWEDGPASGQYRPTCCRDPHVMRIGKDFVMYYVAMTRERNVCAVAYGVSRDLATWEDRGPVLTGPVSHDTGQAMMESPCVIRAAGLWHLFYTQGMGLHHAVSDTPFAFEAPRFLWSVHASEVFADGAGGWLASHVAKPIGRSHRRDETFAGLALARVEFAGDRPFLRPFASP